MLQVPHCRATTDSVSVEVVSSVKVSIITVRDSRAHCAAQVMLSALSFFSPVIFDSFVAVGGLAGMFLIWRSVLCIISFLNQICSLCCGKQRDTIVVHICLGLWIFFLMVTTYTSPFCSSWFSVTCICVMFLRPGDNRFVAECRHNVRCQDSHAVKICIPSECTKVYLFSRFKQPSAITCWLELGRNSVVGSRELIAQEYLNH